jgi:hypothetical protein
VSNRNWRDLSTGQRVAVIILGTIQMGLLVAALWDLAHRDPEEIRGDRRMWAGIVFINWLGPLAYFTIGRRRSPFWGSCSEPVETPDSPEEDLEASPA